MSRTIEYLEVGHEEDVVQDAALGVLASRLRLQELVVSACVEADDIADGEEESAEEPTAVTARPSIDAVSVALAALAPSLQRFGLASCAPMGPLVTDISSLPHLTGLRLDWSTADVDFRDVRLLPVVTGLARAGRFPRLTDLTLCLPCRVGTGGGLAVEQLNRLTSLRRLRLVGVPSTDDDT